jgi:hypothetical protein
MPDRMTIHEEMREQDRQLDHSIERLLAKQIAAGQYCSVHGSPFVAGVGSGDTFYPAKPGGECPVCMWAMIGNGLEGK